MKDFSSILKCKSCGRNFVLGFCDREGSKAYNQSKLPSLCYTCAKAERIRRHEERIAADKIKAAKKAAEDKEKFEIILKEFNVVELNDIKMSAQNTLFILGNGFDLMHGVKSTYYHFRDSMSKRDDLREALEMYLDVKDVWRDFEYSLGKFNMRLISGNVAVDTHLDIAGVYEKDFGMAEFSMAAEMAASPIVTIATELTPKFRKWVNSLTLGTNDRPLKKLFKNGKTLCFNYTEFPETLYGISADNICYIHGCRKNKDDTFVLGHIADEQGSIFDFDDNTLPTKSRYKRQLIELAQEHIVDIAALCDEGLTKNCTQVISDNAEFFTSLKNIKNIVIIGHSMSAVDMPYFKEIIENIENRNSLMWYAGCHGLGDVEHLLGLKKALCIKDESLKVFRTDTVKVELSNNQKENTSHKTQNVKPPKVFNGKRWKLEDINGLMKIYDRENKTECFELQFALPLKTCVFSSDENVLFVVTKGYAGSIFLLRFYDGKWHFINELLTASNQNPINRRLKNIFLTDKSVTFVYNNRMRRYSLENGELIKNIGRRYGENYHYSGTDIKGLLGIE